MKLPKSLLSALVIGIAVQAVPACTKTKESPSQKAKKDAKEKETEKTSIPFNCPACGMG
ncbi:chryseobasin-related MNIO class RiPP peptide [Flavihumibacter petaseus]|uniref:Uncharacterized protein n=1 Tax=Flavihumibacter petaseus NBRC 106054 TaxID=1220578 RepID=A0A0E9N1L6_9BACT|nr:hypothetical protein [Flavihumibacter petaseus]GAO43235.1 hypothetical protein FPE01S_02_03390 [Flavihumibacter petaseus NBRC 106054]